MLKYFAVLAVSLSTFNFSGALQAEPLEPVEPQARNWNVVSYVVGSNGIANNEVTIDYRLKLAVELARKGEIKKGFKVAQETKELAGDDLQFSFKFIDTMVAIAEESPAECESRILNEAIKTASFVHKLECCDGTQDPELGYQFMASLSKLGEAVRQLSPKTCAQLFLAEGKIAENLMRNDQVSEESYARLAESFLDAAIGKAIGGEHYAAAQLLRRAFELGYTTYAIVETDDFLARVPELKAVSIRAKLDSANANCTIGETGDSSKRHVAKKPVVLTPARLWARESIDNFTTFPFKFDMPSTSGGNLSHTSYEGKVVLIDIWATWCPPCRKSIPHMIKLQEKFGGEDFQVVGLSVDSMDNPEAARDTVTQFLNSMKANYPSGLAGRDIPAQIKGDDSLPMVILLGRDGRVKFAMNGYHEYEKLEALTEELLDR